MGLTRALRPERSSSILNMLDELLDARLVLEPLGASLAVERIGEVGIERLRAVLRTM